MRLELGMVITVRLNDEELQFLIVHTGGDGKERLSLKSPLARLLGGMGIGDWLTWQAQVAGAEPMRVELVAADLPARSLAGGPAQAGTREAETAPAVPR